MCRSFILIVYICSFKKNHYERIWFSEDHYSYYYPCFIALVSKRAFHSVNLIVFRWIFSYESRLGCWKCCCTDI